MLKTIIDSRLLLALNFLLLIPMPIKAQLIPDETLGRENSLVNSDLEKVLIEGGAKRGSNLFHSFQEFNVKAGNSVYFANPENVFNILTRVTGVNNSNIFGILGVLGDANLFLINPNGIIFGSDASLDLNGSFVATTANRINFLDGTHFSAQDLNSNSQLSISIPKGLGFEGNSASIVVEGKGHNVLRPPVSGMPLLNLDESTTGLKVKPEKTLALIGGEINFIGGIVIAPEGNIEIGSVNVGEVQIKHNNGDLKFNYENSSSTFQNVIFSQRSFLDAGGQENGHIQVFGDNIEITDSSLLFIENKGTNSLSNGAIILNAAGSLKITGITKSIPIFEDFTRIGQSIVTQNFEGKGADINITANNLIIDEAGLINILSFGSGDSGELRIIARESIQLIGDLNIDSTYPIGATVSVATYSKGKAGDIFIFTKFLSSQGGSNLTTTTVGEGLGGNIYAKIDESIKLTGFNPNSFLPTIISSNNQGASQGGDVFIDTKRLIILDGARVDTSTLADGDAGTLNINATEFIKVSNNVSGLLNPSLIISSANLVDPIIQEILGLPETPSGASGNILLNTKHLIISDGGAVSVNNDGIGNAGTIEIKAEIISLNNRGQISATTNSGEGGNINLFLDNLELFNNSIISSTALGGTGNGGNIRISSELITSLNSQITANAVGGEGGNINIKTKGFIIDSDSIISATSELGLDGLIEVQTNRDVSNLFNQTEINFTPETALIAYSCFDGKRRPSQFESGLNNPRINISAPKPLLNTEEINTHNSSIFTNKWQLGQPIIEGTVLEKTSNGWRLVAANNNDIDVGICY
jgi:filamentous hemagglutinin family protein